MHSVLAQPAGFISSLSWVGEKAAACVPVAPGKFCCRLASLVLLSFGKSSRRLGSLLPGAVAMSGTGRELFEGGIMPFWPAAVSLPMLGLCCARNVPKQEHSCFSEEHVPIFWFFCHPGRGLGRADLPL